MRSKRRSTGRVLLAIFFAAGAFICLVMMLALAFPGSFLESIWRLKPEARVQFEEIGRGVSIVLMAAIGTACAVAAVGLAQAAKDDGSRSEFSPQISSATRSMLCFGTIRKPLSVFRSED